jgi:succinoglycan biosynthesis transport protein ExoP
VSNTELLRIIAEDPDPLVAQYVANALADELQKQSRDFYRASAVSIIEPASRPWVPSSPRKNLNIMMGALVGVTAGLGLALLFENLDSTLHTAEDMKSAAYPPILGRIPATRKVKRNNRLAFSSNGFSIEHESFRRLRTNVLALSPEQRLKTLMATSAERGEGKSTVIANLAVTFAEAGCQVVLVDADLRLPSLQKIFDLPNEIGCTNVLFQEISPDEAVQSSKVAGLHVLTSGPQTEKPAELLGSAQMVQLIGHLSQQFDIVLIDTPCLLSVADPGVLAPLVDGVILIVSLGQTRRETVDAAFQQLADVKANTIGVIVNRAKKERSYYGTKYPPIKTRGN